MTTPSARSCAGILLAGLFLSRCADDAESGEPVQDASTADDIDPSADVVDGSADSSDGALMDDGDSEIDGADGRPEDGSSPPPSDLELAGELVFFEGVAQDPDVRTQRLCPAWNEPPGLEDTTNIECDLEGGNFAPADLPVVDELVVLVWNMERGLQFDAQLAAFANRDLLPVADLLLLSELDRGCSRTGHRDVARELAQALEMNYVFVTEFVELARETGAGGTIDEACEHGNAILSRYPLANVGWKWHRQNIDWYLPPDQRADGEPRLGGRVLLWADVVVGDQLLRAYTLHYESNPIHQLIQIDQAAETAELAAAVPWQSVVGGDTNNVQYFVDVRQNERTDPTVEEFLVRGFVDAHAGLPAEIRGTRGLFVIDLLFGDGEFFRDAGICERERCPLSDHQPVWATVVLDDEQR